MRFCWKWRQTLAVIFGRQAHSLSLEMAQMFVLCSFTVIACCCLLIRELLCSWNQGKIEKEFSFKERVHVYLVYGFLLSDSHGFKKLKTLLLKIIKWYVKYKCSVGVGYVCERDVWRIFCGLPSRAISWWLREALRFHLGRSHRTHPQQLSLLWWHHVVDTSLDRSFIVSFDHLSGRYLLPGTTSFF